MDIKPHQVGHDPGGMLVGTLGHAEAEFVGAMIIRWHHVHQHTEWQPVSRLDLADLLKTDDMVRDWARNPFWKPNPYEFSEKGFIEGWGQDPNAKGTLTEKFFAGLAKRLK